MKRSFLFVGARPAPRSERLWLLEGGGRRTSASAPPFTSATARETSAQATSQLAEIDRRLQTLPAELEALRKKGVEEIAAEEQRIQAKAEAERARLIDEMQRDVDVRIRVARKALAEHAADLAVGLAAEHVRQTITDADQARLIDRYAVQVKDIHG